LNKIDSSGVARPFGVIHRIDQDLRLSLEPEPSTINEKTEAAVRCRASRAD